MSELELLQSVQFINLEGKQVAVLNLEDWQALIEWLETLESDYFITCKNQIY